MYVILLKGIVPLGEICPEVVLLNWHRENATLDLKNFLTLPLFLNKTFKLINSPLSTLFQSYSYLEAGECWLLLPAYFHLPLSKAAALSLSPSLVSYWLNILAEDLFAIGLELMPHFPLSNGRMGNPPVLAEKNSCNTRYLVTPRGSPASTV
jgi:hypothetical protein